MQVIIDPSEFAYADEDGFEDAVIRAVASQLLRERTMRTDIQAAVKELVKEKVRDEVAPVVDKVMTEEFTVGDRWGSKRKTTDLRGAIGHYVEEVMKEYVDHHGRTTTTGRTTRAKWMASEFIVKVVKAEAKKHADEMVKGVKAKVQKELTSEMGDRLKRLLR
jgi:hypothetical protein